MKKVDWEYFVLVVAGSICLYMLLLAAESAVGGGL